MRYLRNLLLLIVLLTDVSVSQALSVDEVQNSGRYYWGMGENADPAVAEKDALAMLANSISVSVKEHTSIINKSSKIRKEGKAATDERSNYSSMVSTYAQATLDNSEVFSIKEGDHYRVIRYIPKENVYKVFEDRRKRIEAHLSNASKQLELNKVDVALKDYYWAYALLQSMPSTSTEEWRGHVLHQYIPAQIDDILSGINISVGERDGNDYQLLFTYNGKPVHSLDYLYYEDGTPGPMSCAGEGYGEVSLLSTEIPKHIEVEIEYKYIDQASDPQMQMILRNPNQYDSKYRMKRVPTGTAGSMPSKPEITEHKTDRPVTPTVTKPEHTAVIAPAKDMVRPEDLAKYSAVASKLLNAIAAKKPANTMRDILTDSVLLKYRSIINAGNAKVIDTDNLDFSLSSRGEVLCRGAVLQFKYRTGRYRSFTRDIAITFNKEGKVSNINMGLGNSPRHNIEDVTAIPPYVRQAIIEFIENYQTAFALRDLDYIERIFDDNAIIITVTVRPYAAGKVEDYMYRNDERLISNRYTKDAYLRKMGAAFKSREYINLRFNKIDVEIVDEERQIYAVSLEQDYFSPSYSDHGYLFLLARFSDPQNPVIHVRTWQPEFIAPKQVFNKYDFPVTF